MTSKLYIKRATGDEKQEFLVELEKHISEYDEKICQIFDALTVKVVHRGRVLEKNKSFEEQGIKEGDTILIVPTKKQNNTEQTTPQTASQATSQATLQATPQVTQQAQRQQPVQQNIWVNNTIISDSVSGIHLYNVEEVHAAFLLLLPTIIANQENVNSIRENPNNVFSLLNNVSTRNTIRQSLKNSSAIVQSLKSGTPINISLQTYQIPQAIQMGPSATQFFPPQQLESQSRENAIIQMFNGLLAGNYIDPNLESYTGNGESETDDEGEENEENNMRPISNPPSIANPQTNSSLTPEDMENIQQIKEFTGASDEDAKIAYLACYKSVFAAVNKILSG